MIEWAVGIGIALLVVILIGWFISLYNMFVMLKNNIEKSWSNINVLLKQRFDEIPNLVETAKGYMKHERQTFTEITQARSAWSKAKSVQDKAAAEGMLAGALKTLFAVAENYPKLLANENFKHLQTRISGLETEIADRREFYNDNVNTYNIKRQQFPAVIVANFMGLKAKDLFQVASAETKPVKVEF
ncbi:MAG: LemA family protein [Nanoarchaeota archaeon]|nr:LemA family protein [Nanoarchaeota archaeon]